LRRELPADAEADAYIAAVEAADGQALEPGVKFAIKNFVLCCKADGIWNAIKASCILAGARTLNGALVPLAGAAPTNFNFVSGDYNRKTGLAGDGSTKYLNSNRACSSETQNNIHASIYASSRDIGDGRYISGTPSPFSLVGNASGGFRVRANTSAIYTLGSAASSLGRLIGISRATSATFDWIHAGENGTLSASSTGQSTGNYAVYSTNQPANYSNARLAFYSIGESLDLALLDARVTDLINAFAAAIP
jgi:hypothetical protein